MAAKLTNVDVTISFPFLFELKGTWASDEAQRTAAWELYVELATRIATVELPLEEGLLREAFTSLHSLFGTTRDILRRAGPVAGRPAGGSALSIGYIAACVLNRGVRPYLAKWHPELARWESRPHEGLGAAEHERAWPDAAAARAELADVQRTLNQYARTLEAGIGLPLSLLAPPPKRDPGVVGGR